jgi:hypothetical protein
VSARTWNDVTVKPGADGNLKLASDKEDPTMWVPGVGHGFLPHDHANAAVARMMDRFAKHSMPSACEKVAQTSVQ